MSLSIIVDGLCKAGNFDGAQRHLNYMNSLGFGSNLVAFNCFLDGLGKAGHIDHALRLFEVMEVKDSFTYTIVVHNLCRARRFLCASKVLVSCLKCGYQVLRATQRAVIVGGDDVIVMVAIKIMWRCVGVGGKSDGMGWRSRR